jgi:predicted transcriptional regulator
MMQVTIEVPDDIAERMRQANGQDVARHILEAYALWAYQTGESAADSSGGCSALKHVMR